MQLISYFMENRNMEAPVAKSTDILKRYKQIRQQTEAICKPLAPEDYVVQPIVDVSPPKWHLAHTTWFFETFLLLKFKPDYKAFHADYDYLFNSYYESVGKRVLRPDRGNLTRPGVSDIYAYREYVDIQMDQLINDQGVLNYRFYQVLEIGLQHEQQHQELLITDIKYILGQNPLGPPYFQDSNVSNGKSRNAEFLEIPEGTYPIGHKGEDFCFDNELGSHQVFLPAYLIMDRLVTNKEYLEFIDAGGYHDFGFWLMEGWEWVKADNIEAPLYWHFDNGQWFSYNLYGFEPLDHHAPVTHISFYEADAFARWKGLRLPTEFEWETACRMHQPLIPQMAQFQESGSYLPSVPGDDNFQFYGHAWEWTGSAYRPYPYFKQTEGALGEYNGKFMVNQMVLRGGSCGTPRDHIRATYRNFFHPHLRWQFTGIRLAYHV